MTDPLFGKVSNDEETEICQCGCHHALAARAEPTACGQQDATLRLVSSPSRLIDNPQRSASKPMGGEEAPMKQEADSGGPKTNRAQEPQPAAKTPEARRLPTNSAATPAATLEEEAATERRRRGINLDSGEQKNGDNHRILSAAAGEAVARGHGALEAARCQDNQILGKYSRSFLPSQANLLARAFVPSLGSRNYYCALFIHIVGGISLARRQRANSELVGQFY